MTVPNTTYQTSLTGDGTTTVFSFSWQATSTSQVQVYVNGVLQSVGVTAALSLVTQGGTVTFTTAPVNGAVILITRNTDYLQLNTLGDNAPLPATTITAMFDKITIMVQQIANLLGGAFQLPLTVLGFNTVLSTTPVAGNVLGIDATGENLTQYTPQQILAAVPNTGAGNVTGPGSSTVGHVALFNATNGQLLEDGGAYPPTSGDWTSIVKSGAFSNTDPSGTFYQLETGTSGGPMAVTLITSPGGGVKHRFQQVSGNQGYIITPTDNLNNAGQTGAMTVYGNGVVDVAAYNISGTKGWTVG